MIRPGRSPNSWIVGLLVRRRLAPRLGTVSPKISDPFPPITAGMCRLIAMALQDAAQDLMHSIAGMAATRCLPESSCENRVMAGELRVVVEDLVRELAPVQRAIRSDSHQAVVFPPEGRCHASRCSDEFLRRKALTVKVGG